MTAQEILKMIEEVDPADTAKLDEIDARVCCYLNHKPYVSHKRAESMTLEVFGWLTVNTGTPEIISFFSSYTRSRDALKAIRPEGWDFRNAYFYPKPNGEYGFVMTNNPDEKIFQYQVVGKSYVSEELAELHAIIQAIEHNRQ